MAAGRPLFKELDFAAQTPSANAPADFTPPRSSRQAHSFTADDVVKRIACELDGDDLAGFEAAIARMRG